MRIISLHYFDHNLSCKYLIYVILMVLKN